MRVLGIAGWSGAGKTTLVTRLIPLLAERGVSVSTVKHARSFEIDHPGKDSYEHRAAGAREVLISSGARFALVHELRNEGEPSLAELLRRLSPIDLVLIEGFKRGGHVKIEVHRQANGKPLLFPEDPTIRALASDLQTPSATLPHAHLDDVARVAELVMQLAEPLDATLAQL